MHTVLLRSTLSHETENRTHHHLPSSQEPLISPYVAAAITTNGKESEEFGKSYDAKSCPRSCCLCSVDSPALTSTSAEVY